MKRFLRAGKFLTIIVLAVYLTTNAFAQNNCIDIYGTGSTITSLATGSPGELGLVGNA